MKSKLFDKIFIGLICLSILHTNTVLAESIDAISFRDYLLNNFKIDISYEEYEEYSLEKSNELEEASNSLIQEHISNVIEYSEIKSQEVENNLIVYGESVKEKIINEFSEIKNNIDSNKNDIIENSDSNSNDNDCIELIEGEYTDDSDNELE